MKASKLLSVMVAGLVTSAAPTLSFAGDDLCKNVSFKFTNNQTVLGKTNGKIKVTKVQYHNVVNDRKPTVDVTDTVCNFGATCSTPGIDLKDVEGNSIKDIKFEYRYQEDDGQYSLPTMQGAGAFNDAHKECRANRSYGPFAITGQKFSAQPVGTPVTSLKAVR